MCWFWLYECCYVRCWVVYCWIFCCWCNCVLVCCYWLYCWICILRFWIGCSFVSWLSWCFCLGNMWLYLLKRIVDCGCWNDWCYFSKLLNFGFVMLCIVGLSFILCWWLMLLFLVYCCIGKFLLGNIVEFLCWVLFEVLLCCWLCCYFWCWIVLCLLEDWLVFVEVGGLWGWLRYL